VNHVEKVKRSGKFRPDIDGIIRQCKVFIYNIQGQDNLLHLKPLFRVSQLIDITIFGMVDNDRNVIKKIQKMKEYARDLGYEKDIRIHIWDRDFETDNFGIYKDVSKVNQIVSEKGYSKIDPLEVPE
jgi:hypothetical protein